LAEALLLGWLSAEGRRRIPARLQRLVPGVAGRQQQQGHGQPLHGQVQQRVQEAVRAAVQGRQQQAAALLGDAAELYLQQSAPDGSGWAGVASPAPLTLVPGTGYPALCTPVQTERVSPLLALVHVGLLAATSSTHNVTVVQLQGSFLSGWVAARGGGRKELVGAVVAAVEAAQQQQTPSE
jgi:hypothetical protein